MDYYKKYSLNICSFTFFKSFLVPFTNSLRNSDGDCVLSVVALDGSVLGSTPAAFSFNFKNH